LYFQEFSILRILGSAEEVDNSLILRRLLEPCSPAFGGTGPYLRDNTKSPFEASHPIIIQRMGHHTASVDANIGQGELDFFSFFAYYGTHYDTDQSH